MTALAALRMVEEGLLSLDEPVCRQLTSLAIPGRNGTNVTLRHILSHTGGFRTIPYSGYAVGSPIPTPVQILQGQPPATTPAEYSNGPLGTWVYSNGAYIFLQVLMTDVTGQAFSDLLHELVLQPLNMGRSTFAQPLPADLECNAACGHVDGAVVQGNWRINPGLASGGLWTTSTDLAHLLVGVRAAYLGDADSIIAQSTAREMLRLHAVGDAPWGLGFALKVTAGVTEGFGHGGQTYGYVSVFALLVESGDGVAILANSNDPSSVKPVYDACETAYGWPSDLLP
ncbi:MAG TPA: serine hydrolase domain-containing protein [Verrucomicrobiota bacterium]|nr:serine hydrolase domain-containing protein [Verrucomicrobiota bacterium]